MYPRLLEIPLGPLGNLPINAYGLMVMLGFLAAILIASRRAKEENISPEVILDIGIISMISGIIGARIMYLIIYGSRFDWSIFNIFDGNLSIPGLIIGWFIPFGIFYWRRLKHKKLPAPKKAKRSDLPNPAPVLTFLGLFGLSLVAAVCLGRLVYLLSHRGEYEWTVLKIWEGGLVFYGGLILGLICGIIYVAKKRLSVLQMADLIAPAIALGLAFARLGCFLNGCCFGKLAKHLPWAVCFPKITTGPDQRLSGSPAYIQHLEYHSLPIEAECSWGVHPVQIYEAIFAVSFFFILSLVWRRKARRGVVMGLLLTGYGIWRFLIEFLRGDSGSWMWGLTVFQIISLGIILIGLVFLITRLRRTRQEPPIKTI